MSIWLRRWYEMSSRGVWIIRMWIIWWVTMIRLIRMRMIRWRMRMRRRRKGTPWGRWWTCVIKTFIHFLETIYCLFLETNLVFNSGNNLHVHVHVYMCVFCILNNWKIFVSFIKQLKNELLNKNSNKTFCLEQY